MENPRPIPIGGCRNSIETGLRHFYGISGRQGRKMRFAAFYQYQLPEVCPSGLIPVKNGNYMYIEPKIKAAGSAGGLDY